MKSSQPLATTDTVHPLAALPFDAAWAAKEARLCRARLLGRGLHYLAVADEDIVSMISLTWWRVCCGDLGSFKPRVDKPLAEQVQAYVAVCIDHEVMRYLHQEGNPAGVHLPKGRQESLHSTELDREDTQVPEQLVDAQDPQVILEEQERQRDSQVPEWPGPLGVLIEEAWDQAQAMEDQDARPLKARIDVELEGGKSSVERVNWAWVFLQAAGKAYAAQTRKVAPLLSARWLDGNSLSVKDLRAGVYPRLGIDVTVADIARQEMRDLLRLLSEIELWDCAISPHHLRIVTEDAAQSMVRWVGKRGPYKKRSAPQDAALAVQDKPSTPSNDVNDWSALRGAA